ncbi:MAG: sodium:proton antiporter [Persicimonas sp.]
MDAFIYSVAGLLVFVIAVYAIITRRDLLRRIVAANVMSAGVFLVFVAQAARRPDVPPDPVAHAMVLTGIVVAVGTTALALALVRRIRATSGGARLPEDR